MKVDLDRFRGQAADGRKNDDIEEGVGGMVIAHRFPLGAPSKGCVGRPCRFVRLGFRGLFGLALGPLGPFARLPSSLPPPGVMQLTTAERFPEKIPTLRF